MYTHKHACPPALFTKWAQEQWHGNGNEHTYTTVLVFKRYSPPKRNQGSFEKRLVPVWGARKVQSKPGHLVALQSKEGLENKGTGQKTPEAAGRGSCWPNRDNVNMKINETIITHRIKQESLSPHWDLKNEKNCKYPHFSPNFQSQNTYELQLGKSTASQWRILGDSTLVKCPKRTVPVTRCARQSTRAGLRLSSERPGARMVLG